MVETTGKIPTGKQLLETLINLLADQEGVKIDAEIVEVEKDVA
jgi:hypothetical protein